MSILHHLVWALVNSIWQSAALAAVVFLGLRCIRRSTAAQRYAVWSAALAACALLPSFDFALSEGWILGRANMPVVSLAIPLRADQADASQVALPAPIFGSSIPLSKPQALQVQPSTPVPGDRLRLRTYAEKLATAASFLPRLLSGRYDIAVLVIWFLASNLLIARLAIGYQSLRIAKRGLAYRELSEREWEDFYRMTARPVAIGYSPVITEPCVIGFSRPTIALPSGFADKLSPDDAMRIMRHECAHISRWDDYGNLFKQALAALIFFNPVVYFVSRALDIDREIACDDAVALAETERIDFAKCLFKIASTSTSRKWVPVTSLVRGKRQIVVRIKELLDANHSGATRLGAFSKLGALAVVASALPFAYIQICAYTVPAYGSAQAAAIAAPAQRQVQTPHRATAMASHRGATAVIAAASVVPRRSEGKPVISWNANVRHFAAPGSGAVEVRALASQRAAMYRIREALAQNARALAVKVRAHGKAALKAQVLAISAPVHHAVRVELIRVQRAIAAEKAVAIASADQMVMTDSWFAASHNRPGFRTGSTAQDELLQALEDAGFSSVSAADLIALRDAGVSAKYVHELHAAGLTPMPAADLAQLADAGVDASFLGHICKKSYGELSTQDLIDLSEAGVSPRFLNSLLALGYRLPVKDVINLAENGVDQHYIAAFAQAGYQNLTANQLIALSSNGVDARYVATLAKLGYQDLSVNDLIRLSNDGVTADFIARLNASGVDASHQISVDDLIKLHDAGI